MRDNALSENFHFGVKYDVGDDASNDRQPTFIPGRVYPSVAHSGKAHRLVQGSRPISTFDSYDPPPDPFPPQGASTQVPNPFPPPPPMEADLRGECARIYAGDPFNNAAIGATILIRNQDQNGDYTSPPYSLIQVPVSSPFPGILPLTSGQVSRAVALATAVCGQHAFAAYTGGKPPLGLRFTSALTFGESVVDLANRASDKGNAETIAFDLGGEQTLVYYLAPTSRMLMGWWSNHQLLDEARDFFGAGYKSTVGDDLNLIGYTFAIGEYFDIGETWFITGDAYGQTPSNPYRYPETGKEQNKYYPNCAIRLLHAGQHFPQKPDLKGVSEFKAQQIVTLAAISASQAYDRPCAGLFSNDIKLITEFGIQVVEFATDNTFRFQQDTANGLGRSQCYLIHEKTEAYLVDRTPLIK